MNKPSIENIDKWLFESVEGNLTPQQEQLLEDFLVQNPAYLDEKTLWEESIVDPSDDEEPYPREKSLLKRAIWERPIFYISAAAATLVGAAIWAFGSIGSHSTTPSQTSEQGVEQVKVQKTHANNDEKSSGTNQNQTTEGNFQVPSRELTAQKDLQNQTSEQKTAIKKLVNTTSNPADSKASLSNEEVRKSEANENLTSHKLSSTSQNLPKSQNEIKNSSTANTTEANLARENKGQVQNELVKESKSLNQGKAQEKVDGLNDVIISGEAKTGSDQAKINPVTQSTNPIVKELLAENFEIDRLTRHPLSTVLNERTEAEKVVAFTVDKPNQVRISSNADQSFASSMRSLVRKVERMMDNPLALYNSKDQYFHAPNMQTLDANFAAVGDKMGPRIIGKSRAQYYGNINQQFNSSLSFDTYVRSLRGGLGVQLDHTYYGNGQINVGQVALTYSPKIGLSKNWVLEPAMRVKVGNMALNHGQLNQGDILELNRGSVRTFTLNPDQSTSNDLWYKDVGLGLMTNSKWFFAGVQVDNLGKHFNNIYSLAETGANTRAGLHFIANVGTDYVSRNKNISLSPYVIYQKMEKLSEIWGGAIFRYKKITLGGAYSSAGGYAGSIGLKTNSFMLTYNADVTTSALLNKQVLSHQMILRILINNGSKGQRMLKL